MKLPHLPEYYYRHAADAFREGFHQRIKVKRHFDTKYDRYHYYLPARLSPALKFLKKYFTVLDRERDIPSEYRFRQTHFEYTETAIRIFQHIRARITVSEPILAWSSACPVPWAVFGPNYDKRCAQNYFVSPTDIFHHYNDAMWYCGYNITSIDRPHMLKSENDPLDILTRVYNRSANFILATALCLLCDIIRFCGPDSKEFDSVFSNDKRRSRDQSSWIIARQAVLPPNKPDFGEIWARGRAGRSSIMSQTFYQPVQRREIVKPKDAYFDVEITDVVYSQSHADLVTGENVSFFQELNTNKSSPRKNTPNNPYGYEPPDDYKDHTMEDIENDPNDIDEEFARMFRV